MRILPVVLCLAGVSTASTLHAQSLQDRIKAVREQDRQRAKRSVQNEPQDTPTISQKMSILIDQVALDQTEARDAFNWWSSRTGIPMVIDWNGLELEGIDPSQPVTMELQTVPARLLLDAIMRQASPFTELIYEETPWYVQVMTKNQANRNPVMRVYDVSDMVMSIPHFTDAPSFNLTDALSNTNSGGGGRNSGSGGSQGIFEDNDDNGEGRDQPTKSERGQGLADMIRRSIEPGIWQANGGQYASVRYYNGRLIVNAPMYVQRQIGIPVAPLRTPRLRGQSLNDPMSR